MRTCLALVGLFLSLAVVPPPAWAQAQRDSIHAVRPGDTLYSISRQYGVSVRDLMQWNDLDDVTTLQVGQRLRLYPPSGSMTGPDTTATAASTRSDTAPAEDTIAATTAEGGLSETTTTDQETLDSARSSEPSPLSDTTAVDTARVAASSPSPYGRHLVETGNTFVGLALRLGTTADTLFALNGRTTGVLQRGRTIRLPRHFGPPTHVVQPGDTIYRIAARYGASVRALRALNDLDTTSLSAGRRLQLPGRSTVPRPPGQWAPPDTSGAAVLYPDAFAGRLMASGQAYAPDTHVVSHPSLPFGSVVLLSRPDAERHAFARVLDRSPATEDALLDVSAALAERLEIDQGVQPTVVLRVVWRAE